MEDTEKDFFDEDSWGDEEDIAVLGSSSAHKNKGPFGVESVDPILYDNKNQDTPELRLSAAYVPIAPKLKVKDSRPMKPAKKKYDKWVPGSEEESFDPEKEKEKIKNREQEKEITPAVRIILIVFVALVPLMVGWFLIQAGLNFY